jgi:hypothetical protein
VGHRLHDGVRHLSRLPNPLRSEAEAFRALVYFVALVAAIVVIVLIIEALT